MLVIVTRTTRLYKATGVQKHHSPHAHTNPIADRICTNLFCANLLHRNYSCSEINRFDPDLWHEDVQRSERFSNKNNESWITMIVTYSRAREIVALAPLLELAPNYMYE